ncbi:phosphate ABC transporter ATP-binding protein PstB [Candidatus Haliotispira prima]|uniref:Phosphate ABC transporter ATP-binding protein PstB n=1 Tax=Candidatus Haliotispira prima TaxID=3034016 RepID=A0ABY8MGM8_9SPIO|nr:phosphate ABC transporter ATP-binding protein PstB [Candidatus Haliotispira prima]
MSENRLVHNIEVEHLNMFYDDFQALYDISFLLEAGKVTALIGPSGCGKSTFIKTLNRMNDLIPNTRVEGCVRYGGCDIYQNYDVIELRKKLGMVFQKPNPFPMSITDNISYGPKVHGERNKDVLAATVERCLKEVNLWGEVKDRLAKSALSLSGGQQQRLCIARTLATNPEVLLMDEPTSALDPLSTSRIEDLISSLRGHYSIIIVTHNMQQAGRISDTTAFFLNGVLEEVGPTKELFVTPKKQKTEEYITGRFG